MRLTKDPVYRKLKIGGRGPFGSVTYWLSGDHLLLVENSGYTERYRNYRLDEIKVISASRTSARLWTNVLATLPFSLLGLLPMLTSGGNPVPLLWGGGFLVFFGTILVVNSVRGPTCSTRIITAVQDAPLKGITRLSKVETLIAAIQTATRASMVGPDPDAADHFARDTPTSSRDNDLRDTEPDKTAE